MNAILNAGKYLFALPFGLFGIFHLMNAEAMKGMAFGSSILVYITGILLIAGCVSIIIGKMDKLATVLLGVFCILMVLLVHREGMMAGDMSMGLKDLALAGAAWMYAGNMAKDDAVIG